MDRKLIALVVTASLGGCITTEEMQIAPNIVQLDTHAAGALFTGNAGNVTLQKAAKATLANGYDLFKLQNTQVGGGMQLVGVQSFGSANVYGNAYGATASGSSFSTPVYARTKDISVSVVMYRRGDAAAKDAFDAKAVVAKLGE